MRHSTNKNLQWHAGTSLVMMLGVLMLWAPCAQAAPPTPSGEFLKWLHFKYGAVATGASATTATLMSNLAVRMGDENYKHPLYQPWKPFQADTIAKDWQPWQATWGGRLSKVTRVGGAMLPDGAPSAPFQGDPTDWLLEALRRIACTLSEPFKNMVESEGALTGMVFSKVFGWVRDHQRTEWDICMPYSKRQVSRKGKKAGSAKHKHVFVNAEGYLLVLCGMTPSSKPNKPPQKVFEYAHRLVCVAFNGLPPDAEHKVVSHLCNNKCCLNPRHLKWSSHQENLHHPDPYP